MGVLEESYWKSESCQTSPNDESTSRVSASVCERESGRCFFTSRKRLHGRVQQRNNDTPEAIPNNITDDDGHLIRGRGPRRRAAGGRQGACLEGARSKGAPEDSRSWGALEVILWAAGRKHVMIIRSHAVWIIGLFVQTVTSSLCLTSSSATQDIFAVHHVSLGCSLVT